MHPILFKIGDFVIPSYGVAIVTGMFIALWLATRLARRRGLPPEFFYDLTFVLLVSGFVGARFFYIAQHWDSFTEDPLGMLFSRSGFVFLGGFMVALAMGFWFARRRRMPLLEAVDVVAPALVLAHAFGRVGCFLAGCCYGLACPDGKHGWLCHLAVKYPVLMDKNGNPSDMFNFAYLDQLDKVRDGTLSVAAADLPLPLMPVQLFESVGNLLICLILVLLWRRRKFSGQIFAFYLVFYSILRFGLEYLRGDDTARVLYFGGLISTSQIITIFTFIAGLAILWWRRDKGIEPLPAEWTINASADVKAESTAPATVEAGSTAGASKNPSRPQSHARPTRRHSKQ